jgi:O-antigen/teichoic acid export membrane protein
MGTMVPRLLNYIILTPYFTYSIFTGDAVNEYGKLTELYAYVTFLLILLTYGMETAYFRFSNTAENKQNVFSTILASVFITSTLFIVIVFINVSPIADLLDYSGEKSFIIIVASIVAIEAFTAIPFAKIRVQEKAIKFAILKSINVVVNIVIIVIFYNLLPAIGMGDYIKNEQGIISVKFVLLANLITSIVVLFILLPDLNEFSYKQCNFKLWKNLIKFGWPLLIAGFAGTINETLDRSLLKHLIADKSRALYDLAVYGANYKIAALILLFIQMYRFALEPFFFNYADKDDSKEQYSRLMNLFVGITVAMGVFILVFLDYIKFFIKPDLHEGLTIIPFIIVAYILSGIYYNQSVWYKLTDKTYYAAIIALIGAGITIFINVYFAPEHSYQASAVAHVISYGFMVILSYFLSLKYFRIKYDIMRIFSYFFLGVVLVLLNSLVTTDVILIKIGYKTILVSFFIIFVIWREDLYKVFFKRTI